MHVDRVNAQDDSTDEDAVVQEARDRLQECVDAWSRNHELAEHDVDMRSGDQWDAGVVRQREEDKRPTLTFNRLETYIQQVVGEQRKNRPGIHVAPADLDMDAQVPGAEQKANGEPIVYRTSDVLEGMIRQIEYRSKADAARDTAFDQACGNGFGYYRLITDYANETSFEQEIRIKRIRNPFSVYIDPAAETATCEDATFAFISDWLKEEEFRNLFPDADPSEDLPEGQGQDKALWWTEGKIRIVEYFRRVPSERRIAQIDTGETVRLGDKSDEIQRARNAIANMGRRIVRERVVREPRVEWRLLNGSTVLEGPTDFPSRFIPVIPVWGREIIDDGEAIYQSLIRHALDAQKNYNYWRPLGLDTPIPTPDGWTTMGAIQPGEHVYDESGNPTRVIGKSAVHINRECYRVTFDDDSSIVADAAHPWMVETRNSLTKGMRKWSSETIETQNLTPGLHWIWANKPLEAPEADLPVDPYVLGFWLGDGCTSKAAVIPGNDDAPEVVSLIEQAGYSIGARHRSVARSGYEGHETISILGLHVALREAGVLGNKHIPKEYLRASENQRWALLQGLMDSDGSVATRTNQCSFSNTNPNLCAGFAELVRSLGIKAVKCHRSGRHSSLVGSDCVVQEFDQFSFSAYADEPVFRLSRKKRVHEKRSINEHRRRTKRHRVTSVEAVDSVPVQCIGVEAQSHLFLAGESMVPTHNSAMTEMVALAPKAPYIGPESAFAGYEERWESANVKNWSYIPYRDNAPAPPQRQPSGDIPAGATQEAQSADYDMKATIGMFEASIGEPSNERSGRAIQARRQEGETGSYVFLDNLHRAVEHEGRIILDMIPRVYDTDRRVRIRQEDGTGDFVRLNGPEGADVTRGQWDISVKAGPSYQTQREEFVESLWQATRAYPGLWEVAGDLLVQNMDWPGADKIADRLRKSMPPQILADEPGEVPQPEPTPQQQLEQMELEVRQKEAEAKMAQAQGNIEREGMKTEQEAQQTQQDAYEKQTEVMQMLTRLAEFEQKLDEIDVEAQVQNAVSEVVTRLANEGYLVTPQQDES